MTTTEFQFDGLVGPTHNYAGLAPGNLASQTHRGDTASPRAAVLQGIDKAATLARLGIPQAVLPPHERPHLDLLRAAGFTGTDADLLHAAQRHAPELLAAAWSASAMWTANAATVSPAPDTADQRLHLSPANLTSALHRSLEAPFTTRLLRRIFADDTRFAVHDPLPAALTDEGAANHTRLAPTHDNPGIEIFTYGTAAPRGTSPGPEPRRFNARQRLAASQAVARRHQLDPQRTLFLQQHPDAIDAGVFHNDVIAVGDTDLLLLHEHAYIDTDDAISQITETWNRHHAQPLIILRVHPDEVSLEDAVSSYLFNSQLLRTPDGQRLIVCPENCRQSPAVSRLLEDWQTQGLIHEALFFDLQQSMSNGGGPACLRLRVVLTDHQQAAIPQSLLLTERRAAQLRDWAHRTYPETLTPDDLADPKLITIARDALDELTRILNLSNLYDFQR
ncbi:N-succinylarginine dihydrolase [Mucisphaera calidilacus]|uniref:N-succinylarginine dihydrolase n=1 Tax=Mucisphaera calidilacus TaxID=2527982 RepID=A0A518BXK0_9BACT|nr:N-succinylarginine dihydrolase [Mucisphaera calidilacus]QDU71707.1 N-succinylarginine dihydrolase [Mucisphaera calidilacus]